MSNIIKAECPHCGKKAAGKDEIDKFFGWRVVNGKTVPQSWCYKCRSERQLIS